MRDQMLIALMGAGSAVGASLIGWIALRMLRGRSLRASLFASAATAVLAVVAGALIAAPAMFLSRHDAGVVLVVCLSGAAVTLALSFLLGRTLAADSRTLRAALRELGEGQDSDAPPRGGLAQQTKGPTKGPAKGLATGELAELSRELAVTSMKLAESRERERALERSRRELVAWVSHDLRTPLAGLRAMAEALEDGVATDPARYHVMMRQAADRLAGMVDDLFELSRIHAGALKLTLESVALADLVDGVLAEGQPLARARGIELSGVVRTAGSVRGDVRELSRALSNLVVNAIRHTPEDGTVLIEAALENSAVMVAVTDACGGIPEEDLDRVFEVAWRGTSARTPEVDSPVGAGAGLGLAIVRGIAEAHSGDVTVGNVEGGCRFELHLPVPIG